MFFSAFEDEMEGDEREPPVTILTRYVLFLEIKYCFLFITEFLLTLSYKVEFAAYETSTVFWLPLQKM